MIYGKEVDLFSAAILLFNMYSGCSPFGTATKQDVYYRFIFNKQKQIY